MKDIKLIIKYGFALFAMFFGSGNLVFPILVGIESETYWLVGFAGLFLTGIVLPLMGLFVIKTYGGDYYKFFAESGRIGKVLLPFFALSLLGSFGVVPRCITVAHGGVGYIFNEMSLVMFSSVFCIISYFLCLKDQILVDVLGKIMSPLLIVTLSIMILFSVYYARPFEHGGSLINSFENGFTTGYQTMDLFAAFFFSALIFKQMQTSVKNISQPQLIRLAVKSSIISSFLTSAIYLGFVYLGAHYKSVLGSVSPEQFLPEIARQTFGSYASIMVGFGIFLSCITTAVALNNIYARFLIKIFGISDSLFPVILLVTTSLAFFISLLDFKNIALFLAPLLEISYPGLIYLTVICLITKENKRMKFYGFWMITLLTLLQRI